MQCVDNILLRLFLYPKLIHLLYSDNSVDNSRFSVNDKIFAKERENTTVFHPATIVQILGNGWIKIKWDWEGFSPGSMSKVHERWIRDDNASRPTLYTHYNYDNDIRIDCTSIGRDNLHVRVPFRDTPTP